jgi:Zn-dependent oligopeptidase
MPEKMISAISKSRAFRMASWVTGQIVSSLFDLDIHTKVPTQKLHHLASAMSLKYNGIAPSPLSLHPAGFGHLAGEYDAGYYSYLWSLVYAHDLFTRFQKEGLLNPKTGRDYRDIILAKGSSEEEMELLKQFLHREPNNKAFLSSLGL